ncbi:23S rRNA (uracil(1939)-C(5))-methyltransferase RlmD [Sediminibacterium sp.]|uniref:23S rRNA (uracil(1939)-C(5))-methyltransferase RlmD n=1 Tax=Sediminibacterium sp. TaxID=1917865 RepID=UPI0025F02514|nr:23S rRNA (uracil(1939)-C(5))-methyltransferase RlmD [Sediminibacterium sp.]MDO9157125.1 23S rRNA (uracil(1939)-C(5))-methyltransferase RlmD [Sediminibacterium sp.]MDP1972984.1 23S rRNA (uracil(1939)-C(5))-methyltransferase RlmD [Sediminibacterium sp.]MDP2419758.1 23S rRNA (uracil(1939)-C(5))-methyltransferase RlmD [Sediminibacterium sp.]
MRKQRKTVVLEKVLVQDYAAEGKSLARVDGKVVFIEGAVPGDVVDVQLSKNKADWAEGHTVHIHSLSSDRVTPFCEHFGVCGGCQWQMLPYEKQLFYKQKQVTDNLTRIAKINLPEIAPIIGADFTRGYRNKMEYTFATRKYIPTDEFRRMKAEGVDFNSQPGAAGFHVRGFFDKVVEIDTCHLQEEPTNFIRKAVAAYVLANELPFYNIKTHEGWIRNLLVRSSTTGELMVNMVIAYEDKEHRIALLDQLLQSFPEITTLLYTINGKRNDSLHDQEPIVYHGKGYIIEKLEELSFKISPKSFFQTNTKQAEKLYGVTREFAELDGSQLVYDLYCGTGSIGLFVSKFAKKLIGVEMVADAIEDAKENAALNGVNHASFFAGDVIDICNDAFFETHGKADVVITDPPRAGMHEKLVKKLLEIAAPTVVYVSCNPATQARDLALLSEKYQVTKIQPVDMFPHTLHIENVVQLKLI